MTPDRKRAIRFLGGLAGLLIVVGVVLGTLQFVGIDVKTMLSGKGGNAKAETVDLESISGDLPRELDRIVQGEPLKVACFGNSLTFGIIVGDPKPEAETYPFALQSLMRENWDNETIEVVNCGTPGYTSAMGLENVRQDVISHQPDLTIVMLGTNDCLNGESLENFSNNLDQLTRELLADGQSVLLLGPPPVVSAEDEKLRKFCTEVQKVAKNYPEVAFFNVHAALVNRANRENLSLWELLPDGVHLDQMRYRWIAEELVEWFKTLN